MLLDCYTYLGINTDAITGQRVLIDSLLSNFARAKERQIFNEFLSNNALKLKEYDGSEKEETILQNFDCIWNTIRSKNVLLGYVVNLTLINEPSDSAPMENLGTSMEFSYIPVYNKFYLSPNSRKLSNIREENQNANYIEDQIEIRLKTCEKLCSSQRDKENTNNEVDEESQEDGDGFYHQLLEKYSIICMVNRNDPLYQRCLHKPNYSKGIIIQRLDAKGNITNVNSTAIPLLRQEDMAASVIDTGERRSAQQDSSGSGKILRNAMKSKGYLYRMIANMPLPTMFNGLIYLSLIIMLIGFGINIAEQIIVNGVLNKIYTNVQATYYNFDFIRCTVEMATWINQAIAVNLYFHYPYFILAGCKN